MQIAPSTLEGGINIPTMCFLAFFSFFIQSSSEDPRISS